MLQSQDFDYHLPEALIAQNPCEKRDHSRLLVTGPKQENLCDHKQFFELPKLLPKDAVLVLNNTKVIPARIPIRRQSGGQGELLIQYDGSSQKLQAMGRPSKRLKEGERVIAIKDEKVEIELIEYQGDGWWNIAIHPAELWPNQMDRIGEIPLPPYITRKEGPSHEDGTRYQTVFAKSEGSTAAPTASLHFTPELLKEVENLGIRIVYLTHHVGAGTFLPVKTENLAEHQMHKEYYHIPKSTSEVIAKAKSESRPIIGTGTTVLRALESASEAILKSEESTNSTELFIYPPYQFKIIDQLITNFHLPKSTLIMLVSALLGHKRTMDVYKEAVEKQYRFFSFGDAMYIR